MKVRKGFVSNSSSSSFVVITGEDIDTPAKWRHLFKPTKRIRKKKLWGVASDKNLDTFMKDISIVLYENDNHKKYEDIKYTTSFKEDMNVCTIPNAIDLLCDSNSWLYEEIKHRIRMHIIHTLQEAQDSSLDGNLDGDLRFSPFMDIDVFSDKMEVWIEEIIDNYIRRLVEALQSEKVFLKLVWVSSESSSKAEHHKESSFLRMNWEELIREDIEFFKFRHD